MNKSLRARAPLTDEDLAKLTADELVRLKLTAEEKLRLKELSKTREKERIERSVRLRVEEELMLTDLRAIGLSLESVWDLVNTSNKYRQAIPVLIKHLQLPYSDSTREGIARSLAVTEPEARKAWPILVDQYRRSPTGWGTKAPGDVREYRLSAKDGLACALSVAVSNETLPELVALAKDRSHGESRVLLLSALRKSDTPLAKQALTELATDPELEREIASWQKR